LLYLPNHYGSFTERKPKVKQNINTMQIEPHTLKSLNAHLQRGDKTEIARITGYTPKTVENAFKGDAITPAVREIAAAAYKLINKRRKEAEEINSAVK
jgi:activator of 2-hydroxyglutaryl-CoA dehydratase